MGVRSVGSHPRCPTTDLAMQFARLLVPLALILATVAALGSATQAMQTPGPATGPSKGGHEYGTPPDTVPCPGIGTKWQNGHIVTQGITTCPEIVVKINLGFNEQQIEVIVRISGCPSYVVIAPGHYGQINKPGYLIGGSQSLDSMMQELSCVEHWFFSNKCATKGAPTPTSPKIESYSEKACGHVIGTVPQ
jgi:hypothetical protein